MGGQHQASADDADKAFAKRLVYCALLQAEPGDPVQDGRRITRVAFCLVHLCIAGSTVYTMLHTMCMSSCSEREADMLCNAADKVFD